MATVIARSPASRVEASGLVLDCPHLWCDFKAQGSTPEQARFFLREHELMEHLTN